MGHVQRQAPCAARGWPPALQVQAPGPGPDPGGGTQLGFRRAISADGQEQVLRLPIGQGPCFVSSHGQPHNPVPETKEGVLQTGDPGSPQL